MLITVEATYEGGVLKLRHSLPFAEHETVQVTVQAEHSLSNRAKDLVPGHAPLQAKPAAQQPEVRSVIDSSGPKNELSDFADSIMVDLWLEIPPSRFVMPVNAGLSSLPLPDPPTIPLYPC